MAKYCHLTQLTQAAAATQIQVFPIPQPIFLIHSTVGWQENKHISKSEQYKTRYLSEEQRHEM